MSKKIIFTTGGTGGHIYPALAVAKKIIENGDEAIFIGTSHRMEKDIVPENGYKFYGLDVLPLRSLSSILKLIKAIFEARKILKKEKPNSIIGFGNYISLPTILAAKSLGIPIFLQEQNVTMGQANKWCYPLAKNIFLAFSETLKSINPKYKDRFIVTGNPIREEFFNISKEIAREKLDISKDKEIICVMGGSLGAKNINEAILSKLNEFEKENIELYWATGKEHFKYFENNVKDKKNIHILPYFEDSFNIIAASDLLLCRAGASTISELIELEKPSILIPYNFVGQKENAEILELINATKIYSNENASQAIDEAIRLVKNKEKLKFMSENIRKIKPGNATENIVNYL